MVVSLVALSQHTTVIETAHFIAIVEATQPLVVEATTLAAKVTSLQAFWVGVS